MTRLAPRMVVVVLAGLLAGCASRSAAPGERRDERIVRPEEFGAVGDGVHDDTKAIQSCIDRIASQPPNASGHRGTVLLERTYFITRQHLVADDTSPEHKLKSGPHGWALHVRSGVTLAGGGTVTLLQAGASSRAHPSSYTYAFWICPDPDRAASTVSERWPMDPARHVSNVVVRDITVVNDPASLFPPFSETSAFVLHCPIDVRIENVTMRHWHRGLNIQNPIRCTVERCTIEDSRYFAIAVYLFRNPSDSGVRIVSNTIRGNTFLSGGIYASGRGVEVRDNTLSFTNGIFAEYVHGSVIAGNRISRSPYGIRVGYLAGGPASGVEIGDNEISGCVGGIMVGNASAVRVRQNLVRDFIEPGSDIMIEPPNGYWGYGRCRAGINVEDSANVQVAGNTVRGLNSGVPVGIRVSNSRLTADLQVSPYQVTDRNDPPGVNVNSGNIVRDNQVDAVSGLRIGYYLENQQDYVLTGNAARGTSSNRVIACTGRAQDNKLDAALGVVTEATPGCRRLILDTHPMHHNGVPVGPFKYSDPPPPENEYFPVSTTAMKGRSQ